MPLKLIRRKGSDNWHIHGTVAGQRIRETTGTADRRLAEEIRAKRERDIHRAAIYGVEAVATWEDACLSYLEVREPKPNTKALLRRLTDHFGRLPLKDLDQRAVDRACAALCRPDAKPATKLRNVIVPVRAVLTHAARRGLCKPPAFETPRGATGVRRTRWLTPAELAALCAAAATHLRPLIVFLAGTGARLSEALELDWNAVDLQHRRAVIWQKQQRERHLDLPPAVVAALATLPHRDGRVFRTDDGRPYADHARRYGGQISTAWAGACRRAGIVGATPHTLRHTWASYHYALYRDLLRLKQDGDWSTVALVERYAKLVPETMVEDVRRAWGLAPGRRAIA